MKKLILSSLLCVLATAISAQTIWYVSPNGMGTGTSWPDACRLQQAVQNAAPGDEVWVMEGIYYGNLTINTNITIRGGFAGTENQIEDRSSLSAMDISTTTTTSQFSILDAQQSGSTVTVNCDRFIMDRFTLRNGDANFGGGLYMQGHTYLHLKDMHVCDNMAQVEGGGLYIDAVDSILIENIVVSSNIAHSRGGGINFVAGHDMLLLINALIVKNRADLYGGGLVFENTGAMVINSTIVCNTAGQNGSAISLSRGTPTLYNTLIWGNNTSAPVGLTIFLHTQPSNITYYSCNINSNYGIFYNFLDDDYRLNDDSNNPCKDSGIWPFSTFPFSFITTDLDHEQRCVGTVDIGAYEIP